MAPNIKPHGLRTWLEISQSAVENNIAIFRLKLGRRVRLMSVVKSNAYGHGLYAFSSVAEHFVDWFGVDSIVEGLSLRKRNIKKPILVLGATLAERLDDAAQRGITITVSNKEMLRAALSRPRIPEFHIKLDTGMHRQGFQWKDMEALCAALKKKKSTVSTVFKGIYTHFAQAKGASKDSYTERQLVEFEKMSALFQKSGFENLIRHAAATAGTLMYPQAHYDMVRVGIGLYGIFPSRAIASVCGAMKLTPALTWRSVIVELKEVPSGSFIGYDCTEKVRRHTTIAIIPIGYWHGFDRGFSGIGSVLIRGTYAKILGRVSMDMIAVDGTGITGIRRGDTVTVLGKDGKNSISAEELAARLGTIPYEVITRINPLIERIIT